MLHSLKSTYHSPLNQQTLPNQDAANTTNSVDSIMSDVNNCQSSGEYKITHVILDWIDQGQAIEAGRKLNGPRLRL